MKEIKITKKDGDLSIKSPKFKSMSLGLQYACHPERYLWTKPEYEAKLKNMKDEKNEKKAVATDNSLHDIYQRLTTANKKETFKVLKDTKLTTNNAEHVKNVIVDVLENSTDAQRILHEKVGNSCKFNIQLVYNIMSRPYNIPLCINNKTSYLAQVAAATANYSNHAVGYVATIINEGADIAYANVKGVDSKVDSVDNKVDISNRFHSESHARQNKKVALVADNVRQRLDHMESVFLAYTQNNHKPPAEVSAIVSNAVNDKPIALIKSNNEVDNLLVNNACDIVMVNDLPQLRPDMPEVEDIPKLNLNKMPKFKKSEFRREIESKIVYCATDLSTKKAMLTSLDSTDSIRSCETVVSMDSTTSLREADRSNGALKPMSSPSISGGNVQTVNHNTTGENDVDMHENAVGVPQAVPTVKAIKVDAVVNAVQTSEGPIMPDHGIPDNHKSGEFFVNKHKIEPFLPTAVCAWASVAKWAENYHMEHDPERLQGAQNFGVLRRMLWEEAAPLLVNLLAQIEKNQFKSEMKLELLEMVEKVKVICLIRSHPYYLKKFLDEYDLDALYADIKVHVVKTMDTVMDQYCAHASLPRVRTCISKDNMTLMLISESISNIRQGFFNIPDPLTMIHTLQQKEDQLKKLYAEKAKKKQELAQAANLQRFKNDQIKDQHPHTNNEAHLNALPTPKPSKKVVPVPPPKYLYSRPVN